MTTKDDLGFKKFLQEKTRLIGNVLFFEDKPFALLNLENGTDPVVIEKLRMIYEGN